MPTYNRTDLANVDRLLARVGAHLWYVPRWETWLFWGGQCWKKDQQGAILVEWWGKLMKGLQKEPEGGSAEERTKCQKWATSMENMPAINRMREAARNRRSLWLDPPALDPNPWLLGTPGGTMDLTSGALRPANPADLLTRTTRVTPDFSLPIPTWLGFLERIFAGDEALISSTRRLLGYCLTGETREQCLAVFYGTGANGKSTLLEAVAAVMGEYATPGAPGVLESRDQERHPCEIADLAGRRLVTLTETDRGVKFSEGLVKRITGEKSLKGRFMHQDWFEFPVTFKLIYAVNHQPSLSSADAGIQRRLLQFPFGVRITDEERDMQLPEKLRAEYPGILAWLIQGCLEYQQAGLSPCRSVRAATSEYLSLHDVVGDFLADCTEPEGQVSASALYLAWTLWAKEHGEREISQRMFSLRLIERGIQQYRTNGERGWSGLRPRGQARQE